MVDLVDKKLECRACNKSFVFTKGEQSFYLQKAYSEPRRCPDCRKTRRKEKRKSRQLLIKSLEAAENVTVETVVVGAEEVSNVDQKEDISIGLEPVKPEKEKRKGKKGV